MIAGLPVEFLVAIKKLPANEQALTYTAIWEYAEFGAEPESLFGTGEVVFILAKCWIDRERKEQQEKDERIMTAREYGKMGGRPRKNKGGEE